MKKVAFIMWLVFLMIPALCKATAEKSNSLILLNAQTKEETEAGIKLIEQNGGDIRHVFPPDVLIAYFPERMGIDGRLKSNAIISQIFHQRVDPATISSISEIGIQGVKSWNYLLTEAGKK